MDDASKLDARLTVRLRSETKHSLALAAKRKGRSTNWLAQTILEKWVKGQKHKRAG